MAPGAKVSSMTAFAQHILTKDIGTFSGELRAVNSRFFEFNCRLPEALRPLETVIRDRLRAVVSRGKIDLGIRFEVGEEVSLQINKNLVHALLNACQEMEQHAKNVTINALDILRWPGALTTSEKNQEALEEIALELLEHLIYLFQQDRQREGAALQKTIESRLETIHHHISQIEPFTTQIVAEQRQKLLDRLSHAKVEIDQNRLEQELVYWAQKLDVAEELDRLRTHVKEVFDTLQKGGNVGRRLDFLMQELHREANTLGSKSLNSDITYHAIEIKVLIEQMREQVQNLE